MKVMVLVSGLCISLSGCATGQYDAYVKANTELATARANADAARYKALSDIAGSGDSSSKIAAVMALALGGGGTNSAPQQIEAPRNEALQWASILVPSLTQIVGMDYNYRMNKTQSDNAREVAISTNSTYSTMGGQIASTAATGANATQGVANAGFTAMQVLGTNGLAATQNTAVVGLSATQNTAIAGLAATQGTAISLGNNVQNTAVAGLLTTQNTATAGFNTATSLGTNIQNTGVAGLSATQGTATALGGNLQATSLGLGNNLQTVSTAFGNNLQNVTTNLGNNIQSTAAAGLTMATSLGDNLQSVGTAGITAGTTANTNLVTLGAANMNTLRLVSSDNLTMMQSLITNLPSSPTTSTTYNLSGTGVIGTGTYTVPSAP